MTFGIVNPDPQQVAQAVKIAQAESFIKSLPDGIDSHVAQKGSNFSGGQKTTLEYSARISEARSHLLFDDSFSALDYQTDANLRRALKSYVRDSAVVIVAQRVATVMDADQIIVLDEGKIVGKGTHSELMETCSTYQEFAASQGIGGEK